MFMVDGAVYDPSASYSIPLRAGVRAEREATCPKAI